MTLAVPAALCTLFWAATAPIAVSLRYQLGIAMLYSAGVASLRAIFLERQYQANYVECVANLPIALNCCNMETAPGLLECC